VLMDVGAIRVAKIQKMYLLRDANNLVLWP
jgi:hypothetical protein